MTPRKSPRNRPYVPHQPHGHYALEKAVKAIGNQHAWLTSLGEVGEELKAWRTSIIADLGGEDAISAMERAIVELAVKTHLMLESVDKFLLEQDSLVNKSKRQLFPVVLQRQALADALARYMAQLGLKRRAKLAPKLRDYLTMRGQQEDRVDREGEERETMREGSGTSEGGEPG